MAGTEKMAQVIQKFAPKTDDLDWIPGTNMVGQEEPAFKSCSLTKWGLLLAYTHKKKKQINKQTDRQTDDRQTDRQTR